MKTPREYVAGFLFNADCSQVLLIEKQKPEWQKGRYNAIGGKIETYWVADDYTPFETPLVAMRREFKEETGVEWDRWEKFCVLSGSFAYSEHDKDSWIVHFFYGLEQRLNLGGCYNVAIVAPGEERIFVDSPLPHYDRRLPNLRWLIPMALGAVSGENRAKVHLVTES